MIGIDIIDIAEAKKASDWKRPRFLEKLFTLREQKLIHDSEHPFIMVWRLWSMKEAAYKLYTQIIHPERFYNPKQFQCDINATSLKVTYKAFQCFISTKITEEYILSEASLLPSKMVSNAFKLAYKDYKSQSKMTTEALMSSVSNQYNLVKSNLKISKSEFGIPSIYYNSEKLNISMSLSHHGHFGSYATVSL